MKNVEKGTSLTESDLFRLSDHGGWTADRARLPAPELDRALAIVKPLIPAEKLSAIEIWSNELIAQYVGDLQKRAEATQTIKKRPVRSRPHRMQSEKAPEKLTTTVRRELKEIIFAISEVRGLIDGLASPGRTAINGFFRRNGLVGRTRMNPGCGFWQTWRNACDAFLLIQIACERFEERGSEVFSATQAELAKISEGFDLLTNAMEALRDPTRKVLKFSYRQLERSGDLRVQPGPGTEYPITDALSWLSLLHSVAAAPKIEVKRGRDEAPGKRLCHGWAALYREMTGKEPARTYRGMVSRRGDPPGEAGDLLELARILAGHGNSVLPETIIGGTQSLSTVIRDVLEERKGT